MTTFHNLETYSNRAVILLRKKNPCIIFTQIMEYSTVNPANKKPYKYLEDNLCTTQGFHKNTPYFIIFSIARGKLPYFLLLLFSPILENSLNRKKAYENRGDTWWRKLSSTASNSYSLISLSGFNLLWFLGEKRRHAAAEAAKSQDFLVSQEQSMW